MKWVKLKLHFPSFYSYRIPGYSSQYALSLPLPSPSAIKLGLVATAIRTSGSVREGEKVFDEIRDAEIRIQPPEKVVVNSFLIKRLKKKKQPTETQSFEKTFGVREYVHFSDDISIYIGYKNLDTTITYLKMLRYLGTGDSLLFVKEVECKNVQLPDNTVRPISKTESVELIPNEPFILYPIKDLSNKSKFEHINPFAGSRSKNVFEDKYYLLRAKIKRGKNWALIEFN